MHTYVPKLSNIKKDWYLINAEGLILGRLASKIVRLLRGKEKVDFIANLNMSNIVIIENADKLKLSGRKLNEKLVYRYSGHPGGLSSQKYGDLLLKNPSYIIRKSIKGMLPKNKLSNKQIKNLKIFRSSEKHPYGHVKNIQKVDNI